MTNTVKMQHYVPRSYLQNFATNTSKGAPTVYCFSKPDRNQFKTSVTNIGGENYFYDIPEDPDQEFESQLANIEAEFNQACNTLLEAEDLAELTENDRTAIAYSVAIQDLRTRESREQLLETVSKLHGHLETESLTAEMAEWLDELQELSTSEGITRFQRDLMEDGAWDLAEIILQMKWVLLKNNTEMPYWTSDHPVVRHNDNDFGLFGNMGLQNKGIQVYLPLSESVSLSFSDPAKFGDVSCQMSDNEEGVRFQNSLQVRESTKHIFASTDNFSMTNDFLDEYPIYADIDRDRVSVE